MEIKNLSKSIFEKLIDSGATKLELNFSGGSDEGYLDVEIYNNKSFSENSELHGEVEEWAWDVYSYNGAGCGPNYGDEISYDLVNKKATHQYWEHVQKYDKETSSEFKID